MESPSDVFLPEGSPHRLVVHVRFVLVETPQTGDGFRVHKFKDT